MASGAVAASGGSMVNAMRASGVIVRVTPENFLAILRRVESPLVVQAQGGIFSTKYSYLVSYKGLAFYTKSPAPIELPRGTELVQAKNIWIPNG